MRRTPLSLGEVAEPDEYGWVKSILRERAPSELRHEDEESLGLMMENDLVRTVLYTFVLGGLTGLLLYFARGVVMGEGRHVFLVMATLAALLACAGVASRSRRWLRSLLVLGSLCVLALLVDQFVYYRWHKQVERIVAGLQQGVEPESPVLTGPMQPRPTSFFIDPDGEIRLMFEPPILAWTYYLDAASSLGHTLVADWYRVLSRAARGRHLDGVVGTIVRPHEVYAVSVRSDQWAPACRADESGPWTVSIDRQSARRSM